MLWGKIFTLNLCFIVACFSCVVNRLPPAIEQEELPELSSSSDSETPDSPLDGGLRMYPLKPRRVLQRRNTITGATPTSKRPYPKIEQVGTIF